MSDPGQLPAQTVSAAQIATPWLREGATAFTVLVRPIVMLACGLAVAVAAIRQPGSWEVATVAAGVATGVAAFRSVDKWAQVGGRK